MLGRPEGLRRLDLSPDGFWTSFFAIPVALPPTALSWIAYESLPHPAAAVPVGWALVYGAHALADLLGWLLPVVVLMSTARWIGFSRKIVPLVIATNWGGALMTWAIAPYWLVLIATGDGGVAAALGLLVSIASIVLTVRLVSTAIGRDLSAAVAIVMLMIVATLVATGAVSDLTGVPLA